MALLPCYKEAALLTALHDLYLKWINYVYRYYIEVS